MGTLSAYGAAMSGEETRIHLNGMTPGELALLRDIAEVVAEKTVEKTLTAIGLEPTDPIASQALFGALRKIATDAADPEKFKDDEWTRRWRTLTQGAFGKAFITAIGLAVYGGLHALWSGIKAIMPSGPPPH